MISYMGKGFREFVKKIQNANWKKSSKVRSVSGKTLTVYLLAISFFELILIEAVQRTSLIAVFLWIYNYPQIFILNYLIILLLYLFFLVLFGRLNFGTVLFLFFLFLFSIISLVKYQFLGDPLFPWDFGRLDQVVNLMPKIVHEVILILLFMLILLALFIYFVKLIIPSYKFTANKRIVLGTVVLSFLGILTFYRETPLLRIFDKIDIEHIYWLQSENTFKNGLLLGFTMNIQSGIIISPSDYSYDKIKIIAENICKDGNKDETLRAAVDKGIKPNLIIVMNEAFWDPTVLPNISFSSDPIPFFRELQKKYSSGNLVSPVYGGSTANVEFEILTGLSINFFPKGAIAYQQYITKPLPSLASLLADNGYETIAIHPYHGWFYKRDKVYSYLGFNKFISLEDFNQPIIKGEYVWDGEVAQRIINEIKQVDSPAFIFVVTMQNHGPYPSNRYKDKKIFVNGPISSQAKEILSTYALGLTDSDYLMKTLTTYFQKTDQPTILVFFGDHLPYLGKNYFVYRETGYISADEREWTLEENFKMKTCPLVIWTNYGGEKKDFDYLSPSFLGYYLLQTAGIKENLLFRFTGNFSKVLPVFNNAVNMDNSGILFRNLPQAYNDYKSDYWLIEYDLLFGEQYFLDFLKQNKENLDCFQEKG